MNELIGAVVVLGAIAAITRIQTSRSPFYWLRRASVYCDAAILWSCDRAREVWLRRDRFAEILEDVGEGRR